MQSRRASLIETVVSLSVGFGVAWCLTYFVLPWWGLKPSPGHAIEITILYTVASLIRTYCMRRLFNRLGKRAGREIVRGWLYERQ